jgi:hypothetical protein
MIWAVQVVHMAQVRNLSSFDGNISKKESVLETQILAGG